VHLAVAASQGCPWAALDMAGVPFSDPLDVTSYAFECVPFREHASIPAPLMCFMKACIVGG
jgi:hypothetical protein